MAWQTDDLTTLAGAPPAALGGVAGYVVEQDGTRHVIYYGAADNHIHELRWDTNGRHDDDWLGHLSISSTASCSHFSQPWRVTNTNSGKSNMTTSIRATSCGANGNLGPGTPAHTKIGIPS